MPHAGPGGPGAPVAVVGQTTASHGRRRRRRKPRRPAETTLTGCVMGSGGMFVSESHLESALSSAATRATVSVSGSSATTDTDMATGQSESWHSLPRGPIETDAAVAGVGSTDDAGMSELGAAAETVESPRADLSRLLMYDGSRIPPEAKTGTVARAVLMLRPEVEDQAASAARLAGEAAGEEAGSRP